MGQLKPHRKPDPAGSAAAGASDEVWQDAMLKLLVKCVSPGTFERQMTEVHIRMALRNRLTHFGPPQTARVG